VKKEDISKYIIFAVFAILIWIFFMSSDCKNVGAKIPAEALQAPNVGSYIVPQGKNCPPRDFVKEYLDAWIRANSYHEGVAIGLGLVKAAEVLTYCR
jgi:hypothetical protein